MHRWLRERNKVAGKSERPFEFELGNVFGPQTCFFGALKPAVLHVRAPAAPLAVQCLGPNINNTHSLRAGLRLEFLTGHKLGYRMPLLETEVGPLKAHRAADQRFVDGLRRIQL